MSHSREWMIEQMAKHLVEMQQSMLLSGVKIDYLKIPVDSAEREVDDITTAYTWLSDVYNVQYKGWHRIRRLLSEEQWARYAMWEDFSDHRECVLLRKAGTALRSAIVTMKRPKLFRSKSKSHKSEVSES